MFMKWFTQLVHTKNYRSFDTILLFFTVSQEYKSFSLIPQWKPVVELDLDFGLYLGLVNKFL